MFAQFDKLDTTNLMVASGSTVKPLSYRADEHSPLILDSELHQAHHAALIAAGCQSQVRQEQRS